MKIKIFSDASDALNGLRKAKQAFNLALETGIQKTAKVLMRDCRPYIPMLTGKLRDSGHIERVEDLKKYTFYLVWNAVNIKSGFSYAEVQYTKVLQHVDGRYAAEWLKKTLQANPGRYQFYASVFIRQELAKALGNGVK